jgi:hypothetical protein
MAIYNLSITLTSQASGVLMSDFMQPRFAVGATTMVIMVASAVVEVQAKVSVRLGLILAQGLNAYRNGES